MNPLFNTTMTDADYRKAEGLSQSSIKKFLVSPAHYLASTEEVVEPTKAMQLGTAFHAVMLQPNPKDFYAVKLKMDGRTKEGKAYNEQFEIENAGKAVIDTAEEEMLFKMRDSVMRHPTASKLARFITHRETALFGEYEGVKLKGLMDGYIASQGIIVDYKSCEDASPAGFKKAIWDFRYDIQNVQYPWLLTNAGMPFTDFYFICVEKKPPYAVGVYKISNKSLEKSHKVWEDAILRFKECSKSGVYPAYSEDLVEIVL